MNPLLSIVIPTCDRAVLLVHTVKAYVDYFYEKNVEILVSDNFSTPETYQALEVWIKEGKIRYVRTDKRLSMPDHWEFAWQKASGEYIMFNGDDDICLISGFRNQMLDFLHEHRPNMVGWRLGQYYHPAWHKQEEENTFSFQRNVTGGVYEFNVPYILREYGKISCEFFPHALALIFRKEIADAVKKKHERICWHWAPDLTSSVLLLAESKCKYYFIDFPIGFGGKSANSNAIGHDKRAPKETEKRQKTFFDEFGDTDPMPYHPIKIFTLFNYVASALSVGKEKYPEYFGEHQIDFDYEEFFYKMYMDISEIYVRQPLLQKGDMEKFDRYAKSVDREKAEKAYKRFLEIKRVADIEAGQRKEENPLEQRSYVRENHAKIDCNEYRINNAYELDKYANKFLTKYFTFNGMQMNQLYQSKWVTPLYEYYPHYKETNIESTLLKYEPPNNVEQMSFAEIKKTIIKKIVKRIKFYFS